MGGWMDGYLARLARVQAANLAGGGETRQAELRALGKWSARERIARLVDAGSFEEVGSCVTAADSRHRPSPCDGLVMGCARVAGRPVMVYAFDFSVMSGALGDQAAWKLAECVEMAGQRRLPLIGVLDSAGARLGFEGGAVGFNGLARLLHNLCRYSGVAPRIAIVAGPCTGLLSLAAVLSDFAIQHADHAFLWLGGPLESAGAGGAEFHMEKSGQCDRVACDEGAAIADVRTLLAFLPGHCGEKPPRQATGDDPERRDDTLRDVLPDNPKFTYDIHAVIERIVDVDTFFELKADFAPHLVTGLARFDGYPAGIVANNPDELSGILEPDASDKYDRFMNFLDAFNIPLVTLVDTTAFPPGDRWERMGIIRHGAKLLHSYANLTCPKITVVLRRAYGGANIVLGCSRMYPDLVYAWPTAEFAPTGPETVVHAVFHKELEQARREGRYDAVFDQLLGILKEQFSVLNLAKLWTTYYTAHEVIDPCDTRPRIVRAIAMLQNKVERLPAKRGAIKPA